MTLTLVGVAVAHIPRSHGVCITHSRPIWGGHPDRRAAPMSPTVETISVLAGTAGPAACGGGRRVRGSVHDGAVPGSCVVAWHGRDGPAWWTISGRP